MTLTWYLERYYRSGLQLKKLGVPLQEVSVVGGLESLDPTKRIQAGLEADNTPLSADDLKNMYHNKYLPNILNCPLYLELKKIWAHNEVQMQKFESLTPWEKLEFLELFFGLTTSQTTVEFISVDFNTPAP